MGAEQDLIQKLMISKKIMDKHNQTPRSGDTGMVNMNTPSVESFNVPKATYNLPQEMMGESTMDMNQPLLSERPTDTPKGEITEDRILNSKLPDEIKQLMIEHPINQPNNMAGPGLSSDLVEKASRLMNGGNQVNEQPQQQRQQPQQQTQIPSNFREILKEVVTEVLTDSGVISESTSKSNETFSFKVGKHLFEGKVLKVKKMR